MYSMVLMMALTGGADTLDSHRNRGGGCYGSGGYSGGYGGNCAPVMVGCAGGVPVAPSTNTGNTGNTGNADTGTNVDKDMPKGGEPVGKPKDETLARGTIQVILPADATLTVD